MTKTSGGPYGPPVFLCSAREPMFKKLATPAGFEPATHSLEGCCSIQLSYGASVPVRRS